MNVSKRTQTIIVTIAVLSAVLFMVRYVYVSKKPSSSSTIHPYGSMEMFQEAMPKVILFHASWCGYCQEYLSKNVEGSDKNTFDTTAERTDVKGIKFEKVDADEDPKLTAKYGIKGFPTIVGVNAEGEKVGVYEGDRYDMDDLASFAKSLLSA